MDDRSVLKMITIFLAEGLVKDEYESAIIFSPEGEVVCGPITSGEKDRVDLPSRELYGNIIVHNHPFDRSHLTGPDIGATLWRGSVGVLAITPGTVTGLFVKEEYREKGKNMFEEMCAINEEAIEKTKDIPGEEGSTLYGEILKENFILENLDVFDYFELGIEEGE